MIEIYFIIFFVAGLAWGYSLAPIQHTTTKNLFKFEVKENGVVSIVKQAKANLERSGTA